MQNILDYINQTWDTLTDSNEHILKALQDPKFPTPLGAKLPLYIAGTENPHDVWARLAAIVPDEQLNSIQLLSLPKDPVHVPPGLLFLPHPYVVPGGRFNEMYGWDSYFIMLGLLLSGRTRLAQHMVDNHLYQVQHYGMVLNANRTYYLTRSQPPFLSSMVCNMYEYTHDKSWLAQTLPLLEKYYQYWTTGPNLTPSGLSRFYDSATTPAAEVLASERTNGLGHYERVNQFYKEQFDHITDYDPVEYYNQQTHEMTPAFYSGDAAMRATGFDPSYRFGPLNADVLHYTPACLNSLLYKMETDMEVISRLLDNNQQAELWRKRSIERAQRINTMLWDETDGLYYDWHTQKQTRRRYPFLTTFYPLWAGLASQTQAEHVRNNLFLFEKTGGLQTSTNVSGCQWDAPYGWAPLHLIAVEGLRRYGFTADADRISNKFLSLIYTDYVVSGTLHEKYNVDGNNADVAVHFGYAENVTGFGWTNAVFLALYNELSPTQQSQALSAYASSIQKFPS